MPGEGRWPGCSKRCNEEGDGSLRETDRPTPRQIVAGSLRGNTTWGLYLDLNTGTKMCRHIDV